MGIQTAGNESSTWVWKEPGEHPRPAARINLVEMGQSRARPLTPPLPHPHPLAADWAAPNAVVLVRAPAAEPAAEPAAAAGDELEAAGHEQEAAGEGANHQGSEGAGLIAAHILDLRGSVGSGSVQPCSGYPLFDTSSCVDILCYSRKVVEDFTWLFYWILTHW